MNFQVIPNVKKRTFKTLSMSWAIFGCCSLKPLWSRAHEWQSDGLCAI